MQRNDNTLSFWSSLFIGALRLCPPGTRGKTRLAKLLLGSFLKAQNITVKASFNSSLLVPSLKEPIGFYLLIDGVYEPMVTALLSRRLKPGATFVDIGANIGVFSLLAAKRVGPSGKVLAVEASPTIFPYLIHNVVSNGTTNIQLKQAAASDQDSEKISFYEAPGDQFGMGALAPQFGRQPIQVEAFTLDRMLEEEGITHVDVLKVDVEGFEAKVFQGACHLFGSSESPLVIFEFADWAEQRAPGIEVGAAQRILLEHGFRIWRLSEFARGNAPLPSVLTAGGDMLVAAKK